MDPSHPHNQPEGRQGFFSPSYNVCRLRTMGTSLLLARAHHCKKEKRMKGEGEKKQTKMSLANVSGGLICLLVSPAHHAAIVGTVWEVALNLDIHRFTVSAHRLSFISVSGILGQTFRLPIQRDVFQSRSWNRSTPSPALSSGEREERWTALLKPPVCRMWGGTTPFFNSCSGLQILLIERAHVSEIYWERGWGINRFDGNTGLKCEAILEACFCRSTLSFKRMLWATFLACGKKKIAWLRGSPALHWRRLWSLTRRASHEKVSGCTKGQAGGAISKNRAGMWVTLEKNPWSVSIWNWFCTYQLKVKSCEMHFGRSSFRLF